jgi:hypothetical protein
VTAHFEPSRIRPDAGRPYERRLQLLTMIPVCGLKIKPGDTITHEIDEADCPLCVIWWRAHVRDCLNRMKVAEPKRRRTRR